MSYRRPQFTRSPGGTFKQNPGDFRDGSPTSVPGWIGLILIFQDECAAIYAGAGTDGQDRYDDDLSRFEGIYIPLQRRQPLGNIRVALIQPKLSDILQENYNMVWGVGELGLFPENYDYVLPSVPVFGTHRVGRPLILHQSKTIGAALAADTLPVTHVLIRRDTSISMSGAPRISLTEYTDLQNWFGSRFPSASIGRVDFSGEQWLREMRLSVTTIYDENF